VSMKLILIVRRQATANKSRVSFRVTKFWPEHGAYVAEADSENFSLAHAV